MSDEEKRKRVRRNINYWRQKFWNLYKNLSDEDRKLVDSYWSDIIEGINGSTRDRDCQKIEDLDVKKECLEFEELIFYIPIILSSQPSHDYVIDGVKFFTNQRKKSWFDDVIHKKEYLSISNQNIIFQIIGNTPDSMSVDIAIKEKDWSYSLSHPNINNANPLDFVIFYENQRKIDETIKNICSSGKHAETYERIFDMMFDGIDVTGKNAGAIGVPQKKMASIKSQALRKLKKNFLEISGDTELAERHATCKAQKEKKYEVQKSTFKQRKASYRIKNEKHEPITTRIWKLIDGVMTLILDVQGPLPKGNKVVLELR